MQRTLFLFAIFFTQLSWIGNLVAAQEKSLCEPIGRCVNFSVCTSGLRDELNISDRVAKEFCGLNNDMEEINSIRLVEVFPRILQFAPSYRAWGINMVSAVQLLLFTFYQIPAEQMDAIYSCTSDFVQQVGVNALRSHDNCENLIKYHPDKREQLFQCTLNKKLAGMDPEIAFSTCIREIFPR